jgi:hypothetical protein
MVTNVLIFPIAILGLIMIVAGVRGLVFLWNQRTLMQIPLSYYGMAIGMICGGFGMLGIAQGLFRANKYGGF